MKVTTAPTVVIQKGQIGVVTAMDGAQIETGRLLAKKIEGYSNFENGELFLANGGQKGPQIDILLPGTYCINLSLFRVEIQNAAIIPSDKIGLITAKGGDPLPESEYVAKHVEGHGDFQNGSAFLDKGGQRGPQFDVLRPVTYYINPLLFAVELDDVAKVERGQVAVVVSNVGKEPPQVREFVNQVAAAEQNEGNATKPETRLALGIERYVVPKGFRSIQQEVAGPGIYYLNRRAYMAYIIDTTNQTIDWDEAKEIQFDPLKVISRDRFDINVSVKVIIRVRPDQAPYIVTKIGSIENLIHHVIHPMIDSSFCNQASSTSAINFLQDRQEKQKKAEDRARNELDKYHG